MATSPPATPAQAVLALYGALDHAAGTGNADIEATIAHYLPGSSGPNTGWYEELLGYLGHRESHFTEHATVPDVASALDILAQEAPAPLAEAQQVATFSGSAPESGPAERPLSSVQKARMMYAISTLSQLPGWYLQNAVGTDWEQKFIDALPAALDIIVRGVRAGLPVNDTLKIIANEARAATPRAISSRRVPRSRQKQVEKIRPASSRRSA